MEISLKTLKENGAFVGLPVKKHIEWQQFDDDGNAQTFDGDIFIRKDSCLVLGNQLMASKQGQDPLTARIASVVCDSDGEPIFDYEQASLLNENLAAAILKAISEVGGPKK